MILHAGLIALRVQGRWRGVLIQGPAGAGKSDLALKALDQGFRLVADDRVIVWAHQGELFGRAPDSLRDRMEIRGVGVVAITALPLAPIALSLRCGVPERMPEPRSCELSGVRIPEIDFDPRPASAAAKLSRALAALT